MWYNKDGGRDVFMPRNVISVKLDIIFKKLFTENEDMLYSFVASMLDVPPTLNFRPKRLRESSAVLTLALKWTISL